MSSVRLVDKSKVLTYVAHYSRVNNDIYFQILVGDGHIDKFS